MDTSPFNKKAPLFFLYSQAVQLPGSEVTEQMIKKRGTGYLTNKDRTFLVRQAVERGHSETIRLLQRKNIFESEMRSNPFSHLNWNNKSLSWDQNDSIPVNSFTNSLLEKHLDKIKNQPSDLAQWRRFLKLYKLKNQSSDDLFQEEGVRIAFILIESADLTYRNTKEELPLYKAVRLSDSRIAERMIQVGGTKYLSHLDREILIAEAVERGHGSLISFLQQDPFDPSPEKKSLLRLVVDKCLESFHR